MTRLVKTERRRSTVRVTFADGATMNVAIPSGTLKAFAVRGLRDFIADNLANNRPETVDDAKQEMVKILAKARAFTSAVQKRR